MDKYWAKFEEKDEDTVRKELAQGIYGSEKSALAKAWLQWKYREREMQQALKQEGRQQMIDQDARAQARFSRRMSFAALIVSILALVMNLFFHLIWRQ